ncbi:MAG TPA: hypothetical protein VMV19_20435 [Xanthobacteraceae bacterium]|nr:hypothetical protein [Xanthobacteraceae bacterium]
MLEDAAKARNAGNQAEVQAELTCAVAGPSGLARTEVCPKEISLA